MQASTNANDSTPKPSSRIDELDWLRCVCILLVVTFHIVWIEQRYEQLYRVVGLFHVPVFLIISGYLTRAERPWRKIIRTMTPWLLSYVAMEVLYTMMASRLPVSDHIERLTLLKLLDVVLLHPIGIYWYLHTLLLCYALLAVSLRLRFLRRHERYVVFLTGCLLANRAGMLSMTNALYFSAGVLLRQSSVGFCRCFAPSLLAVVPFALIACSDDVTSGSLLAFVAVVMIIMILLYVYRHLRSAAVTWATFVGSHTLPILLFSPAFTFAARFYQPWLLALEPTGLLFLLVTLTLTCGMSIGLGLVLRQIFHARMRCMASRVASCVAKAVRRK